MRKRGFDNTVDCIAPILASAKRKEKIDEIKRERKRLCKKCNYLVYIPIDKDSAICRYCGETIFIDDKAKFMHMLNKEMKVRK